MTLPNSLLAYQDCTELLSQAAEDDFGVRYKVDDYDAALHLRSRINYCRILHRRENQKIYEPGDPMYGKSVYDCIVVRIRNIENNFYLYLERNDKVAGEIEPLSKLQDGPEPEVEEDEEVAEPSGVIRRV